MILIFVLCCSPLSLSGRSCTFLCRIDYMNWNSSWRWHSLKGFYLGCSTHMLLQRSPGKRLGNRQKKQQSYRVLHEAIHCWHDSPKASHTGKSLSSLPISHWSLQSILALGFSTGPMTFTVCYSISFAGGSSPY